MIRKTVSFATIAVLVTLFACSKTSTTTYDCTGNTSLTYTANIKSIMDANCATSGCHSASSAAKGYDLSSYSGVKSAAGRAAFLGSIQHVSGYNAMPQGASQLSDANIKLIYCWANNGMAN